jgi:hypothetical protein
VPGRYRQLLRNRPADAPGGLGRGDGTLFLAQFGLQEIQEPIHYLFLLIAGRRLHGSRQTLDDHVPTRLCRDAQEQVEIPLHATVGLQPAQSGIRVQGVAVPEHVGQLRNREPRYPCQLLL